MADAGDCQVKEEGGSSESAQEGGLAAIVSTAVGAASGAFKRVSSLVKGEGPEEQDGDQQQQPESLKVGTSSGTGDDWVDIVLPDPSHRIVQQDGTGDTTHLLCMETFNAISTERDNYKKRYEREREHNSKLAKEREILKTTVTERENEIAALKQEVRLHEAKNGSKRSVASSSSAGGTRGGKNLESHTREQSMKIAELKKQNKDLKDTLEMVSTDKESFEAVIQELEDERDKWKEDFEIAREESKNQKQKITDLENELTTMKREAAVFLEEAEEMMDACKNPQCVNSRARNNQLLHERGKARDSIVSLEKLVVSLKEQIQDLEVAKSECLDAITTAKAEAAVYKSDFEEERRDRAKAQGELEELKAEKEKDPKRRKVMQNLKEERLRTDLEAARASVRALTADVEKLTKQRDDHKYEIERRKKSKSDNKKELEKIKVQLSHASQVAIQSTEKVDAARKEKKAAEKALAKAEERIKKLERAQKQPGSSVTPTKAELLYQEERDRNEELQHANNELRDDIKHHMGIIASLKKLIKEEAALLGSPGAANEKSQALPTSDQHSSDLFKDDPNWIPSEPDLTLEEQLKRGFETAKNVTTPFEAGTGNLMQKQQIKPRHKTVEHRGLTQAPIPQSMDRRRSQEDLLEGAKVRSQGVPRATDQCTGQSTKPSHLPLNQGNNAGSSPASTPVYHDQGVPQLTLAQHASQSQQLPQARRPLRAGGSVDSMQPHPRAGYVQPQHSAPQPQPQYSEHPHVDPRYTDPHHNLPRRGSAQNVAEGMGAPMGGHSPHSPQHAHQKQQQLSHQAKEQYYPQGRGQGGPHADQYEQRQYDTQNEPHHPGNQQQQFPQQHYTQGSSHPSSSGGQYAPQDHYHGQQQGYEGYNSQQVPRAKTDQPPFRAGGQRGRGEPGGEPPVGRRPQQPKGRGLQQFYQGQQQPMGRGEEQQLYPKQVEEALQQQQYREDGSERPPPQQHYGKTGGQRLPPSSQLYGEGGSPVKLPQQQQQQWDEEGRGQGPPPSQQQQQQWNQDHSGGRGQRPPPSLKQQQGDQYHEDGGGQWLPPPLKQPSVGAGVFKSEDLSRYQDDQEHQPKDVTAPSYTYPLDKRDVSPPVEGSPHKPVGVAKPKAALHTRNAEEKKEMASHENQLQQSIDTQIVAMADNVQEEVSEDNQYKATRVLVPFDPNLVCPLCGKRHRIGEIQKFRLHVDNCEGDENEVTLV